jgi:glutamate carboxypeptidase
VKYGKFCSFRQLTHKPALGIPSLDGFGPIGAGFHSASEYLEIDSIEPRIRLLKRVIQSL